MSYPSVLLAMEFGCVEIGRDEFDVIETVAVFGKFFPKAVTRVPGEPT